MIKVTKLLNDVEIWLCSRLVCFYGFMSDVLYNDNNNDRKKETPEETFLMEFKFQ